MGNGYDLFQVGLTGYSVVRGAMIRAKAQCRARMVVLAIVRFQQAHQRLPVRLDELVGEYLTEIPLDPIDHQPLRYRTTETGFVVYSIGPNKSDDGGVTDMGKSTYYLLDAKEPGDWILWP